MLTFIFSIRVFLISGRVFLLFLSIFLFPSIFSSFLSAQNKNLIEIKIISSPKNEVLPGALMCFQKNDYVLSADNNGNIFLKPDALLPYDTAIFSYLGYYGRKISLAELKPEIVNIIALNQKNEPIDKVVVHPRNAYALLVKARDNISVNYPPFPMLMKAYFRETVSENNTIIQQIQAVANIYKEAYNSSKNDEISFEHGNIIVNDSINRLCKHLLFINGTYEALFADIAKNPDDFIQIPVITTNFFMQNEFKFYKYDVLSENDKYRINFSPSKYRKRGVFEGEILLGKENFEILEYSYGYSPERNEKIKFALSITDIQLQKEGVYTYPKDYFVRVIYTNFKRYKVLKSVEIKYCFNFSIGNSPKEFTYCVTEELFINDYKSDEPKKINFRKKVLKGEKLIDQLPDNIIFTDKQRYPEFEK